MTFASNFRRFAGLVLALGAGPAGAATETSTFSVTATVQTTCAITDNNLNFGNYVGDQLDGTTVLQALCSNSVPYSLGLNQGISTGATVTTRAMTGPGGATLRYSLFQDAGRTINWGNTVGVDTVPGVGNGLIQSFTVFGRIPQLQFIAQGNYSDTITVTLTF